MVVSDFLGGMSDDPVLKFVLNDSGDLADNYYPVMCSNFLCDISKSRVGFQSQRLKLKQVKIPLWWLDSMQPDGDRFRTIAVKLSAKHPKKNLFDGKTQNIHIISREAGNRNIS